LNQLVAEHLANPYAISKEAKPQLRRCRWMVQHQGGGVFSPWCFMRHSNPETTKRNANMTRALLPRLRNKLVPEGRDRARTAYYLAEGDK
jgi:hypothetical protein